MYMRIVSQDQNLKTENMPQVQMYYSTACIVENNQSNEIPRNIGHRHTSYM